jgi:hypothetical protein
MTITDDCCKFWCNWIIPATGILAIAGALTGCGASNSVTPQAAPATSSAASSTSAPAASSAPPSSSAPAAPASHGLETTFTVKDTDDNDNPITYEITLLHFKAHATPDNSFDAAPAGKHLAGAEFKIHAVSGTAEDDANNDANLQGTNDQTYESAFETLASGTNFSNGDYHVPAGETAVGWVSFEVPDSVHIAKVQWTPSSGFSGTEAEWTVKR